MKSGTAVDERTEKQTQDEQQQPDKKQEWRTIANDLRVALENLLARYDTYDPESISHEDAFQLYADTSLASVLLTAASDKVKHAAKKHKQQVPIFASLDRLGVPHLKNSLIKILDTNDSD